MPEKEKCHLLIYSESTIYIIWMFLKMMLKKISNSGEAFFWSGRTNGIGGADKAYDIAKSRGGKTLESTFVDKLKESNINFRKITVNIETF